MVRPKRDVIRRRRMSLALTITLTVSTPLANASADSLQRLAPNTIVQLRRPPARQLKPHTTHSDALILSDFELDASVADRNSSFIRKVSGGNHTPDRGSDLSRPQNTLRSASNIPSAGDRRQASSLILPEEFATTPKPQASSRQADIIHAGRLQQMAAKSLQDAKDRFRMGAHHTAYALASQALRLSVEATDAQQDTNENLQDLHEALSAVREAKDFLTNGQGDVASIRRLVTVHTTPVLKDAALEDMTRLRAASAYLQHARKRLVSGCKGSSIAAGSLVILGKVEEKLESQTSDLVESTHMGLVSTNYHMAAALIAPNNAEAQRELGHTFTRQGLLEQASNVYRRSLALAPSRSAYEGLLEVATRLGDHPTAAKCRIALEDPSLESKVPTRHLSPSQFAKTYRPDKATASSSNVPEQIAALPRTSNSDESVKKKNGFRLPSWLPFGRR
ncbi:MAG: hypothetical protein AAF664_11275 [Planctomycetota bacterium]